MKHVPHRLVTGLPSVKVLDFDQNGVVEREFSSVILVSTLPLEYQDRNPAVRSFHPQDVRRDEEDMRTIWKRRKLFPYVLPAAPDLGRGIEGWSALQIFDYFQLVEDASKYNFADEDANNPPAWTPYFRPASSMALDFLQGSKAWGRFPSADGNMYNGVGMAMVRRIEDVTSDLVQGLQERRNSILEMVVRHGDELYQDERTRNQVLEGHRAAARILGFSRPWADLSTVTKNCMFCASPIAQTARGCKHCHTDLLEFAQKQLNAGTMTMEQIAHADPYIASQLAAKANQVAARSAAPPAVAPTVPVGTIAELDKI
jgi:hypothetical protein